MANNIVAYIGVENFDYILYLTRILAKLDRKVLILDNSESNYFDYLFPTVTGIDTEREPITYRHINYGKFGLTEDIINEYDDILISYGMNSNISEHCTRVVIVSDPFLNNLCTIKNLITQTPCKNQAVLIRNMVNINNGMENIIRELEGLVEEEKIDFVYIDEADINNAVMCIAEKSFMFAGISRGLKAYLIKEAGIHYPELKTRSLQDAFKAARKGD